MQDEKRKVQVPEIAEKLLVPRHFLGKIFQALVKEGMLKSTRGPYGGFELKEETLNRPLYDVYKVTDDAGLLNYCELRFHKCGETNHCPLHEEMQTLRSEFIGVLQQTTVGDLIGGNNGLTIENIAAITGPQELTDFNHTG
jgi:Rrf2 family protein